MHINSTATISLITHTFQSTIAVVIDTCTCMPGVASNDVTAQQCSTRISKGSIIMGQHKYRLATVQ